MSELISVEKLIESSSEKGVDFGKGDPYNRLRYYTKMGWLPHMVRKKEDENSDVKGHYPAWALKRLLRIEKLKDQGYTNDEITKQLSSTNILESIVSQLSSNDVRTKVGIYISFVVLIVILATEMGILNIGRSQGNNTSSINSEVKVLIDSGASYVPYNQRKVMVKNDNVQTGSKVYVAFNDNYSPAERFWVSEIIPQQGFIVELDAPTSQDADFTWWVSN